MREPPPPPAPTDMSEHEAESDEDCEVYFLKPVNEYNIVDKIKEANKELFAPDAAANGNGKVTKVTFALNLEDYEPRGEQPKEQSPSPPDELLQQLTQLKLKPIAEEEPSVPPLPAPEVPLQPVEEAKMIAEPSAEESEVEVEEEICEEIPDITEVPQKPAPEEAIVVEEEEEEEDDFSGVDEADLDDDPPLKSDSSIAAGLHRRQDTFDQDYDDEESDQKSLTNLLTESDCEEEERTLNEARLKLREAYKNLYKTLDPKSEAQINRLTGVEAEQELPSPAEPPAAVRDNEADEDDDLSIIVASYIPDDFELNEQSIYYKREDSIPPNDEHSSACPKSSSKTFFNSRRFSFRRRAKPTPTPSSASASTATVSPSIRMNYKTCCEHRHSLQEKLPRYTGYMSEYGLSAQQLQRREQKLRRNRRYVMEQALKSNEHELKKMQDNERAFTTWLKNKMRYPINKTRNMFDAHRRRGSVAAAVASPHSHARQEHSHQHQHPHQRQAHSGLRREDSDDMLQVYRRLLGSWNK
ncbi:fibrous sheath CABYR-binding protein [Drosophila madeirensis]|uniref:Coiled-coil domain-containing protein 181 n=1 Tax=Drosophila madeirensis TaxID=30013 RepID=A0AAU9FR54_DROMD